MSEEEKKFLEIVDLKKGFGSGQTRQEVLRGMNFSVAKAPFPSSGSAGRKGGFLAYGGSTAGFTALPAGPLSFAGIPHLSGCPGHGAWPAVQ